MHRHLTSNRVAAPNLIPADNTYYVHNHGHAEGQRRHSCFRQDGDPRCRVRKFDHLGRERPVERQWRRDLYGKNAVAQLVTYTATDTTDGLTLAQKPTVKFTLNTAGSSVVASPTSVPADGTSTSTITVTLKDGAGNPVSGSKQVKLTAGSGSSTITPSVFGFSNASGVMTFTVKDTVVESVTYTATDQTDGVTITQTATVSFTPVAASFNVVEPGQIE